MKAHTTTSLTGVGAPGPASRLPERERPVFVADHGRRQALMRAMIVLGAVLIAAWLIALVAGALGWGNLPGVPFSAGSDHGQPATSASQEGPAKERAAAQVVSPSSTGGRASSGPSRSSLPAPHGSRSPAGALATPAGSGASAGTGSRQSPGSTGGPPNPGATTPGNGTGSEPGNRGSAPSTLPHENGQPALTPNGNVPAQDAHGGNPNALAYRKGESPGR